MGRPAAFALLLSAGTAAAQSGLPDPLLSVDLTEVVTGIYCADPASRPADPDVTGNEDTLYLSRTPDIISTERQVPARVGMGFGIVYRLTPGGVDAPFDISMTHPPLPGSDGTVTRWQSVYDIDGVRTDGWSFETPDAAQPGLWTLRGAHEGRQLFEVTFEVVPAAQRPDLATACP
ncbi:DUF3859 domain-containing protein [Gymnodinialimonas sp.]